MRRPASAKWATEGRAGTNASIHSAGPNLVVLTTEGDLLVVRRNPEKFEELNRYKLAESQTWAQPAVLVPGGILIRDVGGIANVAALVNPQSQALAP